MPLLPVGRSYASFDLMMLVAVGGRLEWFFFLRGKQTLRFGAFSCLCGCMKEECGA